MRNITTLYREYREQYNDAAKKLMKKMGLEMYDAQLNFQEFDAIFTAMKNDRKLDKMSKADEESILHEIIVRQRTELSPQQARAYQEGYKKVYGEEISLKEAYIAGPANINELNERMIADGITDSYERRHIIAVTFFGSPE